MSTDVIISFKNVCKKYENNEVFNNFNLDIKMGEFVTVLGSSGCGKTTFLKMINGLVIPDSGSIFIENSDISRIDQIKLRRKIGYVIQGTGLFPHLNSEGNITYVLNLINNKSKVEIKSISKKLIKDVGLDEEILKRYPNELSGGQRQRVGIARALASSPNIILMDEPFGAVDEITRKLLQELILKIYRDTNITIVFITHDVREAFKLGTRVIIMDKGKIIQDDTPDNISKNPKSGFVEELIKS